MKTHIVNCKTGKSEIRDLTSEEKTKFEEEKKLWDDKEFDREIETLRKQRNQLLNETDYFALSDQTLTDEMKKYRQDLRDITNGLTTVEQVKAVEFPEKP